MFKQSFVRTHTRIDPKKSRRGTPVEAMLLADMGDSVLLRIRYQAANKRNIQAYLPVSAERFAREYKRAA